MSIDSATKRRYAACIKPIHKAPIPDGTITAADRHHCSWVYNPLELTSTYGTYKIVVDWNNDGDFTDTYDDITADVKEIGYGRGKDEELGKAIIGTLNLRVNNADGKYSPSLSTSVLNTGGNSLLPKRPLMVTETTRRRFLFYGYIETITPHPHLEEQDAFISAIDGLDFLARHELDTVLYKDELTGTLVGNILDSADWSATLRAIDTGQDTVPYGYWNKVRARFALGDIEDSELGFIYINGSGQLVYEDRHHRYSATHQTSQATFYDTMAQITYDYSARNIYNEVRATITPWELQAEAELWKLEETPSLAVGETKTFWGDASVSGESVFVDEWTTLNDGDTDYTASGTVSVVQTNFAKTIKIAVTNTDTVPITITLLKARGTYYDDKTKVSRKAEDSTSQTAYQKRTLQLDGKYLTDTDKAQGFCDYAIARFKDPQAEITMTLINKDSTNLTQILTRGISDRITVQNTKLGLSADFFINKIEHDITESSKVHSCIWHLVDATNEDFWCWDYSKWEISTKWCY